MHTLAVFFSWPSGAVWGNVAADPVIAALGWLWGRRHVRALRRDVAALTHAHRDLADIHAATNARVLELHQALIPPTKPPAA